MQVETKTRKYPSTLKRRHYTGDRPEVESMRFKTDILLVSISEINARDETIAVKSSIIVNHRELTQQR